MEHTLRIIVRAEILPGPIRIRTEGGLTEASWPALLKVLERGATLEGCPELLVDLLELDHLDRAGFHCLQRYVTEHNRAGRMPVMSIDAPSHIQSWPDPELGSSAGPTSAQPLAETAEPGCSI